MIYSEALDWLHGTQLFGIKLGLENITRLATALGCDRPTARIIHVAGTNGKGSVCAMAASIARAAGYRTGLYTSPHLQRFNERIQIDGLPVGDDLIADGLTRIRQIVFSWETHPTFFEITTALALRIFQDAAVEVLVLETGMGGRLDSTNFLTPAVSVITRIDLDHAQWLGPTIADIAREKAGIIKKNVPVITLPQVDVGEDADLPPAVVGEDVDLPSPGHTLRSTCAATRACPSPRSACAATTIREIAQQKNAPLTVVEQPLQQFEIGLAGSHQRWNAALAVHAVQAAGLKVDESAIRRGLAGVRLPGRFQRVGDGLVLDGAHNPAAAARLVQTWREVFGEEKPHLILGIVADKDVSAVVRALIPLANGFTAVPVRSPRALTADKLAACLRENGAGNVQTAPSLGLALETAPRPLLITGSLFLVGEALSLLENAVPPRPSQQ